jgi:hypothetical protein
MNLTPSEAVTVLLDKHAHRYARQFAAEQASVEKGKQVYLNTLAVCAVQSYLKWLLIPTALHQSDCWHPGLRAIFNIADLVLPQIGKLECRPVIEGDRILALPPEVTENRIGYLAVQISAELDRVQLIGFLPAKAIVNPLESILLDSLSEIDELIETIDRCQVRINLRQWLNGIFPAEWQPLELLLATHGRTLRTAANLSNLSAPSHHRGKLIHWQVAGKTQTVILAIELSETSAEIVDIRLKIHPLLSSDSLDETITNEAVDFVPPKLQVTVLDEVGNICMAAETKDSHDWIQLEFSCQSAERFSVHMNFGETTITERFSV